MSFQETGQISFKIHYESSDSFYWLVYFIRALLAGGAAGTGAASVGLVGISPVEACGHHFRSSFCVLSRAAFSPRAGPGLQKEQSCLSSVTRKTQSNTEN